MAWPHSQEYNEAIQSPAICFADAELNNGEPTVNNLGLPMPRSGNFADVYEFTCHTGRKYAIKCFTREVPGLRERYAAISAYLKQVNLPFMVDFTYLDQGIRVRNQWFPVLKMHWVEGFTLNQFIEKYVDQRPAVEALCQLWVRLAKRLRDAKLAHCDLQHGNILLVPGSKATAVSVKLIDYDGMYVPALAQTKSGEVGHPAFQHPQRIREGIYSAEVDRFPQLVIYTALRALTVGGRALWDRYDNGDNLLFRKEDLEAPATSTLFQELAGLPEPMVQKMVEHVSQSAQQPLERTPLLEEVAPVAPVDGGRQTGLKTEATRGKRKVLWLGLVGTAACLFCVVSAVVGLLAFQGSPDTNLMTGQVAQKPKVPATPPATSSPKEVDLAKYALLRFRANDPKLLTALEGHVTLWPNQISATGDASPPQGITGPLRTTAMIYGRPMPVLRFTGKELLESPVPLPVVGSLFVVFRTSNNPGSDQRLVGWEHSNSGTHGLGLMPLSSRRLHVIFRKNGASGDITHDRLSSADFEAVSITWGPRGGTLHRDGILAGTNTTIDSVTPAPGVVNLRIGGPGAGTVPRFTGELAELRVFNEQLDDNLRAKVESELTEAWLQPSRK